jgi:hypothetical protein
VGKRERRVDLHKDEDVSTRERCRARVEVSYNGHKQQMLTLACRHGHALGVKTQGHIESAHRYRIVDVVASRLRATA